VKAPLLAAVLCAASAIVAAQGQGQGQGGGKGDGDSVRRRAGDPACGRDLVVVKADGTRQRHESVEVFLATFPQKQVDQGESPRNAVSLDDVLRAYGADWVEALDCADKIVQLPGGMPVRYVEYLVLTGRGTMKGIREVSRGRYINTVHPVRKLTFHGTSARAAAPAEKP
jgi:hypothetical protein